MYTILSNRTLLMTDLAKKKPSRAESLYRSVKDMAILFEFNPGERINEVELAQRLGASRTPLREALNRLAAEGFLVLMARDSDLAAQLLQAHIARRLEQISAAIKESFSRIYLVS